MSPLKRVGVVSISADPEILLNRPPEEMLRAFGYNTGNLLFVNAVNRQIDAEISRVNYIFDPIATASEFDALVIPAANWVNSHEDWGFLADCIEGFDKPVVLIGLGAQSTADGGPPVVKDGTMRMLRAVSDRSTSISVRGAHSAEVLAGYGINNVAVTGCPSLYFQCDPGFQVKPVAPSGRLVLHGTRYGTVRPETYDRHRWFFTEAYRLDTQLIIQSEVPELLMLLRTDSEVDAATREQLVAYYQAASWSDLESFLRRNAMATVDLSHWLDAVADARMSLGTRLHATIASLNAGVAAALVTHDSRTSEVAAFAGFPSVPISSFEMGTKADLDEIAQLVDPGEFNRRFPGLYEGYARFLESNGFASHL